MKRPLISILMPFYNAEVFLAEAVASIRSQTWEEWELLAIDDGSADEGAKVIRGIGDPRIRLIRGTANRGLPARLNQGIDLAAGSLIARMDADDVAFPERLEQQASILLRQPLLDVVATNMVLINADGRPVGMESWRGADHHEVVARPGGGFHFNHATWLGRAGWFRRHRYREDAVRTEDDDLMLRSFRTSRFYRMPEVLYAYRVGPVSAAASWQARRHYARALLREGRVHRDGALFAGAVSQVFKGGTEFLAERLGLMDRISRHRNDQRVPAPVAESHAGALDRIQAYRVPDGDDTRGVYHPVSSLETTRSSDSTAPGRPGQGSRGPRGSRHVGRDGNETPGIRRNPVLPPDRSGRPRTA